MTEDRHYRIPTTIHDEDDSRPSNLSAGPAIRDIIATRISRRCALKGLAGSLAATSLATGLGIGLTGRMIGAAEAAQGSTLGFAEIPHVYDENLHVPSGYTAEVLVRWGDKVLADAPEFDPLKQSGASQAAQFGYNNDFVGYLPLPQGSDTSDHGLLWVNHEYTIPHLMFAGVADEKAGLEGTTADSTAVELAAHGGSVVEIRKENGKWQMVPNSTYNRRITATTEMTISGPAAGHDRLKTNADPSGKKILGMLNNCSGGVTPWGTILTAEENFNQYFGGDPAGLPEAENYKRLGIKGEASYGWGKFESRFDVTKEPNEPNRFGWIVEIDPYDPQAMPVKRTALGRFKHEAATVVVNHDNRIVVYTGDDERFEHVYKFVSNGTFDPAKGKENAALLDDGILYVAKFDAEGKVAWLPMVQGEGPLTAANGFKSQADVVIEARRAAGLLEATKMDRPEDIETDPKNGRVYVVLTKNDKRKADQVDGPNARADNKWGQILELTPPEQGGKRDHAATLYQWDAFILAGNPAEAAQGAKYGADVSANGWFANPDNIAFDPQGRLWIATDGFTDFGIHDGIWASDVDGPGRAASRHFLGCPKGAEMCGPAFTPDGKTFFVAVQHPGDEKGSNFDQPSTRWPDFDAKLPPRPAVVAVTRTDGKEVGV